MNNNIKLIQEYINNFQLEKAKQLVTELLSKSSDNLLLSKYLAHIYGLKENYLSAIDILFPLEKKFTGDFDIVNNLGHYYLKIEDIENSMVFINKAKKIKPDSPSPYLNSGEAELFLRNYEKAGSELDLSIKYFSIINNNYEKYLYALIVRIEAFIALNKKAEAIEFIQGYLNINFNGELFYQLAQIDKSIIQPTLLEQAHNKLNTVHFTSLLDRYQQKTPLQFGLATYYEKQDKNLSERYYKEGNKEVSEIQRYQVIINQKKYKSIMEQYAELIILKKIHSNVSGKENIFITGLPRSGTTLLESILTSNQEVFAGGELMTFRSLFDKHIFDKKQISSVEMQMIGEEYKRITSYLKNNKNFITDKMPSNFMFLGFIKGILQDSKLIVILRNPWHVALSLFKQRYVTHIPYASSFFNIGVEVANFEASVIFWKNIMDHNSIYFVKYEEIVANLNNEQEKIYSFCNIKAKYEPAARESFFGRTASMNQVRKEIKIEQKKEPEFEENREEFIMAYRAQREYWEKQNIKFDTLYFGYELG